MGICGRWEAVDCSGSNISQICHFIITINGCFLCSRNNVVVDLQSQSFFLDFLYSSTALKWLEIQTFAIIDFRFYFWWHFRQEQLAKLFLKKFFQTSGLCLPPPAAVRVPAVYQKRHDLPWHKNRIIFNRALAWSISTGLRRENGGGAPSLPHAYTFLTCHLLRRKNPHTKEHKKRRFSPKKNIDQLILLKSRHKGREKQAPPQGRDRQTFCCGAVYFRWNYAKSACVRVKKKEGKPMTRGFFVQRRSFTSCFSLPRRDF